MATLTIKNVPGELYKQLKESARQHRRSINSEAIVCLERALRHIQTDEDEEKLMSRIRRLRSAFPAYLTEQERRTAIEESRA